jgi:hypothetical protein
MRRKSFRIFSALMLWVVAGSGLLSAQSYRQPVHIPFDFSLNDRLLPAGTYSIELIAQTVLLIRDSHGAFVTSVMTIPAGTREIPQKSQIVFTRYGDEYFLSRAFFAGYSTGRELLKSSNEVLAAARYNTRTKVSVVEK